MNADIEMSEGRGSHDADGFFGFGDGFGGKAAAGVLTEAEDLAHADFLFLRRELGMLR